tara:strand:- start:38232 stop:39752 length:1521 start_codon:yes stop_codon:yes gene_type:complete
MKKDGVDKANNSIPLPVENALRRKMRSHNKRFGENKETRATLGALKSVYKRGLGTYKPNRAQTPEKWAMGYVNSYLNRLGPKNMEKTSDIFKVRDAFEGLYPVTVSADGNRPCEVRSWQDFVMLAKSCTKAFANSDEKPFFVFNRTPQIVLKVDGKKNHSLFPGKHRYRLVDNEGNTIETGWVDEDFNIADHVRVDGIDDEITSVTRTTLTDEDSIIEDIATVISEATTTEEYLGTIIPNKVEKNATIVFLSLMPTLDEKTAGRALAGSIEKNLTEQIIDPIDTSLEQVSFVNIVPFETLNADGKRSTPSQELVEQWSPVVLDAIGKADARAIVVALGKDTAEHYADVVDFVMPHPFSKSKYSLPRKVEELGKTYSNKFDRQVKIAKSDADRRLVYGVVLEPEVIDAHNDIVSIDEIENAAHNYLIKSRMVGDQHSKPAKADIVESYIAPADLDIGGQQIRKGSWVMVTKVHDDSMWSGIKKGAYTGYSIGGYAVKEPIEDGRLAQ